MCAFFGSTDPDYEAQPDLLFNMEHAVKSAIGFWVENKIFEAADRGWTDAAVDAVTDIVNHDTKSRNKRKNHFNKIKKAEIFK